MSAERDAASNAAIRSVHARNTKRATRLRACEECGKVEEVRADSPATRCRACGGRAALEKGRRTRAAKRNRETCRYCGRNFPAPPSNRQKYCSRVCQRAGQSVERVCAACGSTFRIARSVLSDRTNSSGRFCSRPCYERHLCRTPRIRGRGSRWNTIRKEVLRLTPFCACCGTTRHLQVHHIIPFRLTRDNSPTNLIPLCRACHKRVETVFLDVETVDPPLSVTKLVLFCGIHARRTVTLHMLKSSAHADRRVAT
ncbi:MAG: HNH endonuclease signature motif containing protein [Paracoccaceae bacterium]